jgi:pyoluteorin transport system permease protein
MRQSGALTAKVRRIFALVRKEAHQIVRDPSSIAIGVVMPLMLILIFGYALSLDVTRVPVAVVLEVPSPAANELAAGFALSPYFDARLITSMPDAEELMLDRDVDGIVRIRSDFARRLVSQDAEVQLLLYGADANRARIILGYAQGAVSSWATRRLASGQPVSGGPVSVDSRMWFNEANDSHYFLVPGLVVVVMTLIGAFLTTMVMAREWERGTLEALFVTPVRADEVLLGKTLPYFVMGLFGLALCFLGAEFLFRVPFRGSLLVLAGASVLYLLVALGIGLLISSAVKSQLVASQLTMIATYLPAVMLSGFIFDLRSMPTAVRAIASAFPARYFVSLLQTVFLAGNIWSVILPDAAVMAGMIVLLLLLSLRATRKKLG